ncbi:MAG: universal stress protein, partial [Rhizobacter sp.]
VTKGLEDAKALLKAADLTADTSILPGQPETALGKLVDEAGFDMLVMGAYGHSRIREFILGSTTTTILRHAKALTLILR